MLVDKLHELYRQRLDWAYAGKARFIDSLHIKEFKELYKTSSDGKVNVAVFGNSQVGKTTLIMKLMGIGDDSELHNILRGGQSFGKSVTATTMIYLQSDYDDDYFYYKELNGEEVKVTGDQLREKLSFLRRTVEQGNFKIPDKNSAGVTIRIPKKYFIHGSSSLNINIIDLPGVSSSNVAEHKYVNELIKYIVPLLDITLIIESADYITRLEKISVPEINRFRQIPERFRIILTRTFTAGSEKAWLETTSITEEGLLKRIKGQDVLGSIANFPPEVKVYPIEYGVSWMKMKESNRHLYNKVEMINNNLITALNKDINASITEHNRLMQLRKLTKTISMMWESERAKKDKEIIKLQSEKNEIIGVIKVHQSEVDRLKKKRGIFEREIAELVIADCEIEKPDIHPTLSPSLLASVIRDYQHKLIKAVRKYLEYNQLFFAIDTHKDILGFIEKKCDQYTKDQIKELRNRMNFYSPILSRKEKDAERAMENCKSARKTIVKYVEKLKKDAEESYIKNKRNHIKDVDEKIKGINLEITSRTNALTGMDVRITQVKKELDAYDQSARNDLRNAEKFDGYLYEEFKQQKQKAIDRINANNPSSQKLLDILYIGLITKELQIMERQTV